MTAPGAVVTPVGAEQAIERLDDVGLAAVVGVGPSGTQAVVAVVETVPPARRAGPAAPQLAGRVRDGGPCRQASVSPLCSLSPPSPPTSGTTPRSTGPACPAGLRAVLAGGRPGTP